LRKRVSRGKIKSVEVLENNRVLRFIIASNSSYKYQETTLQFEFTGRNTNAIILDENGIVLEALRHIDKSVSYRSIKVGQPLVDLNPYEIKEKKVEIEDIKQYLKDVYKKRVDKRVSQIKNQKIALLDKKIKKREKILNSLPNEEDLTKKSKLYSKQGELIFANLNSIKPHQKDIELKDWDARV